MLRTFGRLLKHRTEYSILEIPFKMFTPKTYFMCLQFM